MLIELRVLTGDRPVDVAVDLDRAAEVGLLADAVALHLAEPTGRALRVARTGGVLRRETTIAASGLRRGDLVELVEPVECREADDRRSRRAPAALVAVDGPECGTRHVLRSGTSSIGRGAGCAVRIADPTVSRHHADIVVGWSVELHDAGSAHGTEVDGRAVDGPTRVEAASLIRVGNTVLTLVLDDAGATNDVDHDDVRFNRPPRIVRLDGPRRFAFPAPPARQRSLRFPWMSVLAAVLMGVVFLLVGGGGLRTGIFYLFMPALLVAGALESRGGARADHADDVREWRSAVVARIDELCDAQATELAAQLHVHPADGELLTLVDVLGARLWEREPGHPDFLAVRVGLGPAPSHHLIEMPDGGPGALRVELESQVSPYRHLQGSPAVVHLPSVGGMGIAGPDEKVLGLARSVVLQAVALHSPAHVGVAALVRDATDWDWVKWLPHRRTAEALLGGTPTGGGTAAAGDVLRRIEALVQGRVASAGGGEPGTAGWRGPSLVVLYDGRLGIDRARMDELLAAGAAVGVHVVWTDEGFARLPSRLGAAVVVGNAGGEVEVAWTGTGAQRRVEAAVVGAEPVERAALRLAPLVDGGVRLGIDTELPAEVRVGDVLATGPSWRDGAGVAERWSATPAGRLGATIGTLPDGSPLRVDLRRDGPHALVAGTTGSGKSELLQALVCGLALDLPPSRVNFLLVDYKGGAAFRECAALPHTVGLVTDLDPAEVRRALVSLDAELRRREELLAEAGVKDLPTLELGSPGSAPPALVIVVDEFAALSREVPEFVDGVVDIAQRGRSLGLHLVLATQRPAGVVTDTIRANTNLRVALRVADASESVDVIDTTLAAELPVRTPGRAVLRIGASDVRTFQGVHLAARSDDRAPGVVVRSFALDGRHDDEVTTLRGPAHREDDCTTDLATIVAACREAASRLGIAEPFRPWKDPLPSVVALEDLPAAGSAAVLPVGLADDPAGQRQPPAVIDLARDGHVAVFGASGSGKTVLLRSVAVAAARRASGDGLRIHAIDAAGRGLSPLTALPEVGAVLDAHRQVEQVLRLLRTLARELGERAALLASEGVDDVGALSDRAGGPTLPRQVLLIDGLPAFHERYERIDRGRALELLASLLSEGRRLGIHVVMASEQRSGLFATLTAPVQQRVVMRQATPDDEASLGIPVGALGPDAPPGRAVIDGRTCQVAILGGSSAPEAQRQALESLAAACTDREPAPAVPVLPPALGRLALPPSPGPGRLVVGVAEEDLSAALLELDGEHLCVFGPPRSGKTTALRLLADELRATEPDRTLVCVTARPDDVLDDVPWAERARGPHDGAELVDRVREEVLAGAFRSVTLFVDDVVDLLDDGLEGPLDELLRRTMGRDVQVVASGDAGRAATWSDALKRLRSSRNGLLLVPDHDRDGDLLQTTLPLAPTVDMLPGRGYVVTRRRGPALVQLCRPEPDLHTCAAAAAAPLVGRRRPTQ